MNVIQQPIHAVRDTAMVQLNCEGQVRSVLSLDQIWLQHRLRDLELRMDATVQEAYDRGLTAEEHLLPLLLLLAHVRMQVRG